MAFENDTSCKQTKNLQIGTITMHKNLLSIGQALKEIRESKKIPLKKIADQTRINISLLKAIEEGQVSAFPVHAYLRGFILAYAKALGLNEQEWKEELKSLSPTEENEHLSEVAGASGPAEILIEKDMRLTPVILASLILFILGSILVLTNVLSSYKEKAQNRPSKEQTSSAKEPEKPDTSPHIIKKEEKTPPRSEQNVPAPAGGQPDTTKPQLENPSNNVVAEPKESPDPVQGPPPPVNKNELEIIVKALEEVRVHYQVDQGETKSILLAEDQFKVLKGKKTVFIRTRHSDLIYIFYNGKDLGLFGSGGKKEQSFSLTTTPARKEEE